MKTKQSYKLKALRKKYNVCFANGQQIPDSMLERLVKDGKINIEKKELNKLKNR